jgi:enoyl-CoA hydratase
MSVTLAVDANGVADVVVSSPPVNAFSIGDLSDLRAALEEAAGRAETHVVLLRSEGRGFCAGGDVKEVQSLPGFDGILGQARGSLECSVAITECPVPVVGAIHGYCIGVGVLLAGCCDVLVAGDATRFVLAEVDNGATSGVVQALGLLPEKRVLSAMLTCEPFFADELHRYGSVFKVAAEDEVASTGREVATTIAGKRPRVVQGLKASARGTFGRDLRQLYRAELSHTFELNMLGDAYAARQTFVDGSRQGYLAATQH